MENKEIQDDYQDPNFEPQNAQEALEVVRVLRERLRTSNFLIMHEGDIEVAYPESNNGKRDQARIEELIEQYGKEQNFIDYLAGEKVDEDLEVSVKRKNKIESQKKFIEKLEGEMEELGEKLRQARENLIKLEEE